ncbi:MAG TPA: DNA polymerase III subunit [Candidatus Eisenbacteria bacterium]|nr:DNA polymerase III subunit [Candidatus Eisenbacteria bacterium]
MRPFRFTLPALALVVALSGQARAAGILKKSLESGHLAHGLLFLGPRGAGQRQMAAELAKALFCREKKSVTDSCGVCSACRRVDAGGHPDFFVLEPEEDSAVIKMEAVRALISRSSLRPMEAPSQLFVIDRAECLREDAQNALLKTLEEPQGRAVIVLVAPSAESLLTTVRSRLQTVSFAPPASASAGDEETEQIKRRALEFILSRIEARARGNDADGFAAAPDFSKEDRQTLVGAVDRLIGWFRDALLVGAGAPEIVRDAEDFREKERIAAGFAGEDLLDRLELLAQTRERLAANVNVKLAFAALWEGFES